MTDYVLSFDPGTKNISFCLIHRGAIVKWEVLSIEHSTYSGRCKNLANELDLINILEGIDPKNVTVVIEQQMGINTKTNRICGMLFMYFILRVPEVKKIVQYSAKYKERYYRWKVGDPAPFKGVDKKNKVQYFLNENIAGLKKGHWCTKKKLEEHCRRILKTEDQKWIDYFNNNKKKQDDLADSYIQGLSYIKFPNGNNERNWTMDWDPVKYPSSLPTPTPQKVIKKIKGEDDPDYIFNPDTKRYVKRSGKIGKGLLTL